MNQKFLLDILVCPKCHGPLSLNQQGDMEGFVCAACSLLYPVREGIPIMIIEEAKPYPENACSVGGNLSNSVANGET